MLALRIKAIVRPPRRAVIEHRSAPLKFHPPCHWKHPPFCPEKKNISPRFAAAKIASRFP